MAKQQKCPECGADMYGYDYTIDDSRYHVPGRDTLCLSRQLTQAHMVEKAVGRRTGRIPLRTDRETGKMVEVEFPGAEPDPVEVCIADDVMELARDMVLRDAAGDPLVQRLFECFEAGITKPAEVAECLEVDVREVNNAQRRFRRKLDQAFSGGKERQR